MSNLSQAERDALPESKFADPKNVLNSPCPPCLRGESSRATFAVDARVASSGEFEIHAMTAGAANGWNFSEAALQGSLPLWDGVSCFVDHAGFFDDHRSLRDLGGVCYAPEWDDGARGIRLKLHAAGPSGPLLAELGRELLAEGGPKPKIGFSADIGFTASGREVQQILRVFSLDLVFDPARGGAFLRALNQIQRHATQPQEVTMPDNPNPAAAQGAAPENGTDPLQAQLNQDAAAVRTLLTVQQERQQLVQEAEKARAVRAQMCSYLLESGLAASKLPLPAQQRIRNQFSGKVFEPHELTAAIEDARKLVSELIGGAVVAGVPAIRSMFTGADQLQAAVDDMLGAPREKGAENLQVHHLGGIRELYHGLTGDFDFHGGIFPERARFQHTTATFTGLVKNALNKALLEHWGRLGAAGYDWWKRIVHVEHFDTLNQITWMIFGSIGTLPSVAEGAEYSELKLGDSPETSSFTKYGGYIGITLEALDRDDTRKLRAVPRELAAGAIRNISSLVAAIFTTASGAGPTMADGGALFNATAVTTAGGHANLLTTALSSSQWDVVQAAVFAQPLLIANETGYVGTGKPMAVNPRYLLVPRQLWLTAAQILYPDWERTANIHSANQQKGEIGDVVVVPEWTDANDWAAVVDPDIIPGICLGERYGLAPEIFIAGDETSPAVFMNDESRIKVRHYVTVGVADFRPLHKENVA